jgi:hypothetical protein
LEGLGDFKLGGQIIHTAKYADDLVLLAKEEKVLQDMIDKLIEIGRYYKMEILIIFYYINPNKMHMLQSLFYLTTALHVSGVTITHLQQHNQL